MRSLLTLLLLAVLLPVCQAADWPQWRGPYRTGLSPEVPVKLPAKTLLWRSPLSGETHAGLVARGKYLLVPDHGEQKDYLRCFDAETGAKLWTYSTANTGELEFGSCPRATPLIAGENAYFLNAMGELSCLNLSTGTLLWQVHFTKQFKATVPQYGYSSSPLLVDGKLIVYPGGAQAALVALDPATGQVLWQTPGKPAAYASFAVGTFGGVRQLVGYDQASLGGWDIASGKRLWSLVPENTGDFNVGTPIDVNGKLLVATETNSTRLYTFGQTGLINKRPAAQNVEFAPDTVTPLLYKGLAYLTNYGLACFDTTQGLKTLWRHDQEEAFATYSTMIAGNDRLMVFTEDGKLFLVETGANGGKVLGRMELCQKTWSYPALANGKLYIRDSKFLYCYNMK